MARKQKHEEHMNHEAWAIPYGDLITLLLAFFVVMYAVSSVNEGKYRILSDALNEAFKGAPRSVVPIQVGQKISKGADSSQIKSVLPSPLIPQAIGGVYGGVQNPNVLDTRARTPILQHQKNASGSTGYSAAAAANLKVMADEVRRAMGDLIDKNMVIIRANEQWLEVEIKTDILFASGQARVSDAAEPVLHRLAEILKPFPNTLRIEGHTDDVPISTAAFPSNWELSAARAASVVHLFMQEGVDPRRMSVEGWGEYRPLADNATLEGRNRNRRVVLVILAHENAGALREAVAGDAAAPSASGRKPEQDSP